MAMDEQRDVPHRDRPEEHTTSPIQEDRAKPPFRDSDDDVGRYGQHIRADNDDVGARTGDEDERDETG